MQDCKKRRMIPAPFLISIALFTAASVAPAQAAGTMSPAAPVPVTIENHSRPTTCAEEDNVSLTLRAPGVTHFRVEALQPRYLDSIRSDQSDPDFSGCDFNGDSAHPTDPRYTFKPRRVVLYDDSRLTIVGMTLDTFWRPNVVPVKVGRTSWSGFHMVQVFLKQHGKPMEAMVFYPPDGYWRIKPLPAAARFGDGAYGSSMLLGPVEQAGRPVVNIASVNITPQPLSIHLAFARGGGATVTPREIDKTRTALDVTLRPGSSADRPFAMLRSMYVAPDNADVSEVTWRDGPGAAPVDTPLAKVSTLQATDVRFGRTIRSRHNTSAPDIRFSGFERQP